MSRINSAGSAFYHNDLKNQSNNFHFKLKAKISAFFLESKKRY